MAFAVLEREIAHSLTRPVGRPSHKPKVLYHSFRYQARSWDQSRRVVASWGPSNDKQQVQALIERSAESVTPKRLFADAGYDAEWVHELCRDHWGTESVIKPAVHRADGGINGKYRSRMTAETLKKKKYGRRWSVESFMSALKRTTGSMLSARSERALFTEATLRVLAYAFRR